MHGVPMARGRKSRPREGTTALGANLRRLRMERGLTLDQLAKLTGLSKGYVWQLEDGRRGAMPGQDTIATLAAVLKVDERELRTPHAVPDGETKIPPALAELLADPATGQVDDDDVRALVRAQVMFANPTKNTYRRLLDVLRAARAERADVRKK
jgi:transcriptional regulator with XRE-family HTH domain